MRIRTSATALVLNLVLVAAYGYQTADASAQSPPQAITVASLKASASVDPSQTYDTAAKAALKAFADFNSAADLFLLQQNIGGCPNLDTAQRSAGEAVDIAVQLATAASTQESANAAVTARQKTSSTQILCGGASQLGIDCGKPSCKPEIAASTRLVKSATAARTKALLLGAVAANAQGANALRVAKAIDYSSDILQPAFPAAAAAALHFNQAVQWLFRAGSCKEAKAAARSAAAAAKLANAFKDSADPESQNVDGTGDLYSEIGLAAAAANVSSVAATATAALCKKTTVSTDTFLSG